MRLHYTTKIVLGFGAVLGAWFGGRWIYGELSLRDVQFPPLEPGQVNLIGVDTSQGYYIVVANRVAQLVLGSQGAFKAPDDIERANEGEKRRIPIREMLLSLSGDQKALARFVSILNEIPVDELPVDGVVWTAEDIRKAIGGDQALARKLERDLNVDLDGNPLPTARPIALSDGIVLDFEVPVELKGAGGEGSAHPRTLRARVREQFRSQFAISVFNRYRDKVPTPNLIAGFYREEAENLARDSRLKQDVRAALLARFSEARVRELAKVPEKILNSIQVILREEHVIDASIKPYTDARGQRLCDLELDLNEEGTRRLWQYSRGRVGTQLLLVSKGVAVAAPRIDHELSQPQVKITQLGDEGLANDLIETLRSLGRNAKN